MEIYLWFGIKVAVYLQMVVFLKISSLRLDENMRFSGLKKLNVSSFPAVVKVTHLTEELMNERAINIDGIPGKGCRTL